MSSHEPLEALLHPIAACPLCGSARSDAESTAPANLYSEQLALLGNGVCPPQGAAALRHLIEAA